MQCLEQLPRATQDAKTERRPLPRATHDLEILDVKALPTLPLAVQVLLESISNEEVDIDRLSSIIEKIPALSARMVGITNSSYFGFASQITSVKEAIVRALGLKIARNLALALSLSQPLNQNHCPGFSPGTYWLGALLTAHASRQLSPAVSKVTEPLAPDTAYLYGLLRNLGLLQMAFLFPTEMEQVFAKVKPAADSALIEEQIHLIGVGHRTAGAWLMKQWHLSQVIVDASSFDPESTYAGQYAQTCALIAMTDD